jgi:biopolymer transport protein ExbD
MAAKLSGPSSGKNYTVEQNADINVTPFVDIMLVLLIIFMVSIPMATVSIKLDMPPPIPPKNKIEDPRKPAVISILKDGTIALAGAVDKTTTIEDLPNDLNAALLKEFPEKPDPRDNPVFIRAEADVKYEKFMDVLNKLEDVGYLKVGLVTEDIT